MIGWLKRWFTPAAEAPVDIAARLETCLKEEDEALLTDATCPDCLTEMSMHVGPEGGSATNCMCIACRHEWNLLLFNGVTILEDMGRASEERARTVYGWEKDTAEPKRIDA